MAVAFEKNANGFPDPQSRIFLNEKIVHTLIFHACVIKTVVPQRVTLLPKILGILTTRCEKDNFQRILS